MEDSKKKNKSVIRNLEGYHGQEITYASVIRLRCKDCCGGDSKEVRLCTSKRCPLWPFRLGGKWQSPGNLCDWWKHALMGKSASDFRRKGVNEYQGGHLEKESILNAENVPRGDQVFSLRNYNGQRITRRSAVRLMCLNCCGNSASDVETCPDRLCVCWPYKCGGNYEDPRKD